ncbi:MAG: hypothetical protein MZW92_35875 [Comamonadaceae bacterium]|nr:hypothetical protein [Comamonadaceae bacterium]
MHPGWTRRAGTLGARHGPNRRHADLHPRRSRAGSFSKAAARPGHRHSRPSPRPSPRWKQRLGARLLNRNTRGVSPTEVGALYYDKCKAILREIDEADNLADADARASVRRHAAHQHLGGLRPPRGDAAGARVHARAPGRCGST